MNKKQLQLPDIPEEEQTPTVKALLVLLAQFAERIQQQDEEIIHLKDEICILKGEKKRPKFKASKMDSKADVDGEKNNSSDGQPKKRAGSKKKAKNSQLTIHEEKKVSPEEPIPDGSRFKGYRDFVVQNLKINVHNTRFRLERWITPEGKVLMGQLPEELNGRHFDPQMISYILYQHHHCQTTQPLLLEQLREWGVDISSGQINQILASGLEAFHDEKDAVLQAGLTASSYVTVDDSGARHQGKNGYVTQIGNDFFAWFSSTYSKSRENFLELLRAGNQDYYLTEAALDFMQEHKLPQAQLEQLRQHLNQCFIDKDSWQKLLATLSITTIRHCRIATEGALLGSVLHHGLCNDLAIISDDAGQFNVLTHGLCWVHTERLIHKLLPLNDTHREEIAHVRDQVWTFYAELKTYKSAPSDSQYQALHNQFDNIFTQETSYATLNSLLKRIHRNKTELLLVLDRPEIPLHTNGSETDIRDYVKKRKVSGGTRSDEGRRCRDTFASLKKTCRKLGISFWQYLTDRLAVGEQAVAPLPEIILERAAAPTY